MPYIALQNLKSKTREYIFKCGPKDVPSIPITSYYRHVRIVASSPLAEVEVHEIYASSCHFLRDGFKPRTQLWGPENKKTTAPFDLLLNCKNNTIKELIPNLWEGLDT